MGLQASIPVSAESISVYAGGCQRTWDTSGTSYFPGSVATFLHLSVFTWALINVFWEAPLLGAARTEFSPLVTPRNVASKVCQRENQTHYHKETHSSLPIWVGPGSIQPLNQRRTLCLLPPNFGWVHWTSCRVLARCTFCSQMALQELIYLARPSWTPAVCPELGAGTRGQGDQVNEMQTSDNTRAPFQVLLIVQRAWKSGGRFSYHHESLMCWLKYLHCFIPNPTASQSRFQHRQVVVANLG
jgi:hypothetical protein